MTTTSQAVVLTTDELSCLRECAQGRSIPEDARTLEALAAKGMLDVREGRYCLTPAAEHLLHAGEPGTVPGIDN
jgi:hypothetical protein